MESKLKQKVNEKKSAVARPWERKLWADSDGLCLFTKRLERGRFVWPVTRDGKVHLTPAQLSMLLEGINWKHPKRTERAGIRI